MTNKTYNPSFSGHLANNTFLKGNADAPEHEIFEVVTMILSSSSRLQISYNHIHQINGMLIEATKTPGIQEYLNTHMRAVVHEKKYLYDILQSIPHSDEHDLL